MNKQVLILVGALTSLVLAALVLMMLFGLNLAWAGEYEPEPPGFGDPIRLDGSMVVPSGEPGQTITLVIPLMFSSEFGWNSVRNISIGPTVSTDPELWPFEIKQTSYLQNVRLSLGKARPNFNFTISQQARAGVYPINFTLTYVAANGSTRETKINTISTFVQVLSDGTEVVDEEKARGQIVLGAVKAPSAAYGERLTMDLELINNGPALSNVSIWPVVSSDLEKFPFVVERQSYEQAIGSFPAGSSRQVSYDFLLSEYVSSGAKAISFQLEYTLNGVRSNGSFTAYVDVSKAKDSEEEEEDEESSSVPKLIVSSYNISPDKVYAGAGFTLDVDFTNTSDTTIQNITIYINNADPENAYVVPAKNGSNTIYVRSMAPGAVIHRSLEMQVRPDTPAKPNMMTISMEYENAKGTSYTATPSNITVPINQEIRVVVEEPRFDNPSLELGMTAYPYFSILNMGKSPIYNTMVKVEGPGLSLEESHYAGTIQAGTQYAVDIGIIAQEAGEILGEIVVSFEDEYGDVLEERLPFTLYVQEAFMPQEGEFPGEFPPGMEDPGMMEGQSNIEMPSKGLLGAIGVAVIVGGLLFWRKRKAKKRAQELAEDDDAA